MRHCVYLSYEIFFMTHEIFYIIFLAKFKQQFHLYWHEYKIPLPLRSGFMGGSKEMGFRGTRISKFFRWRVSFYIIGSAFINIYV